MWKYLANGKSSLCPSFFLSQAGPWWFIEFITVCLAPLPPTQELVLEASLTPATVSCAPCMHFIYLWRKFIYEGRGPKFSLDLDQLWGIASRFTVHGLRECLVGKCLGRSLQLSVCKPSLLTRRFVCLTPSIRLSQVQDGAQESAFWKSVLSNVMVSHLGKDLSRHCPLYRWKYWGVERRMEVFLTSCVIGAKTQTLQVPLGRHTVYISLPFAYKPM